ncbi:hypothetical protein [Prosthecobacter vanneervenii]|uniref:Uncharacterized protein n=1 Tax=Prosthecobacter vanneervenii TaxID=48466 RepID=A0A7W7YBJ4_9BACT|nr:hypothetical protein [Prosthecobacter vanneervenii]MBB5033172.1 hypothetical protein [Prosthecobacter vanneervenii]
MSQNRTLILREPGHIVLDAAGTPAVLYSETPWTVEMSEEVVPIPSAMFGELDRVPVGRMIKIKGTPQQFSAGAIAKLFPFAAKKRGASLLPSTDETLDIHTTTGKRCRIPNAFVYAEPEIRGDIRKTPIGEVEFWGVVPLNGNANSLASFFSETSVAYPGDDLFDTAEIINPAWQVTWGGAPWDSLDLGESGFSIKPAPKYDEDKVNGIGVTNVVLTDYGVGVDIEPMNITRAAVMARAGYGTALGGRKSTTAYDFIAQASGIYIAVRNAALVPGQNFSFAAQQRSVGKLKLQSIRSFSGGEEVAQLYVGTSAPA